MRHVALVLSALVLIGCQQTHDEDIVPKPAPFLGQIGADISDRRAQFVQVEIGASVDHLSAGDQEALGHLVAAAKVMDEIFLIQAWTKNPVFFNSLSAYDEPDGVAAREYFRIMYGPWDRLAEREPFIGAMARPEGAGFYPEGLTEDAWDQWLLAHPKDRESFESLHTVISVDRSGGLKAVPYRVAYEPMLQRAGKHLIDAAAATTDATLARFLRTRAEAFHSDDYFESDLAWMDLAGDIEVVVGPYEVYEDSFLALKAAFESFVCVVNPEDSAKLEIFKSQLPTLEANLPIPEQHKNLDRGSESPIKVADEIWASGDARAGVQTIAFNLPNDERVREEKGSKKVLLKNVMEAKYDAILVPIARKVLSAGGANHVSFDAFFNAVLFHELSHGLGPGRLTIDGRETEVRLELKDLYSAFEEAKADVIGLHGLYAMIDAGHVDDAISTSLPWTYIAGLFRSSRFGIDEAHGLGTVMQINALLASGGIEIDEDGRFRPVDGAFRAGIEELATELLMVQALGSYSGAEEMKARLGSVPLQMRDRIADMDGIPVDIDPVFTWSAE